MKTLLLAALALTLSAPAFAGDEIHCTELGGGDGEGAKSVIAIEIGAHDKIQSVYIKRAASADTPAFEQTLTRDTAGLQHVVRKNKVDSFDYETHRPTSIFDIENVEAINVFPHDDGQDFKLVFNDHLEAGALASSLIVGKQVSPIACEGKLRFPAH